MTMYSRILVALDGSELAEQVLPHAMGLAEKLGARVLLVRATDSPATIIAETAAGAEPAAAPIIDPGPIVDAEQQEAADYLATVAERLRRGGVTIETDHPEATPAEAILGR